MTMRIERLTTWLGASGNLTQQKFTRHAFFADPLI